MNTEIRSNHCQVVSCSFEMRQLSSTSCSPLSSVFIMRYVGRLAAARVEESVCGEHLEAAAKPGNLQIAHSRRISPQGPHEASYNIVVAIVKAGHADLFILSDSVSVWWPSASGGRRIGCGGQV